MATPNVILPEKGKNNILITSALPYVNNVPHLGNIVGSVLSADVFSRFSKLRDRPTLFICGTDEYGTATETKALETGQTPKELCDEFHKKHKDVYDWFEIGFDYFGRTTTEQQTVIAQDIFTKLYKNGYMEERTTTQPYCEKHEAFLADRYVEGLEGRSITRDLKWGTPIPLPGYENKVLYVWFDACIGYPSITANYTKDWELWWRDPENVKLYQFMGKDNVPFHTVIFPGSQMGTGDKWTMLNHLSTTEYLNYENGKFSKSRGVGVFGDTAKETGVPPSVWRYYLLANRPETNDSQFEWTSFIQMNNSVLLANLGNFVNRVIKFVNAKCDGVIPEFSADYKDESFDFPGWINDVNGQLKEFIDDMEAVRIRAGLEKLMQISTLGNNFLQYRLDNANLAEHPERTHTVIGLALNLCYLLASITSPFMPSTAESIVAQLNAPLLSIPDKWDHSALKSGHKIGKAAYLFTRIDEKKGEEWRSKFGGTQASRLAEEEAKAKKKADKERDKERKRLKKEAAKKEADALEKKEAVETELPLRGKVAEEQAPPPAAAP
ncbi:hypothetical protein CJF30_00006426 [Rutstroemia sp. NJR-2017a BBW]|nr:hypothetical protein CJF30_00006426 [Rutstroemia sp. NJR-2017a BBW]